MKFAQKKYFIALHAHKFAHRMHDDTCFNPNLLQLYGKACHLQLLNGQRVICMFEVCVHLFMVGCCGCMCPATAAACAAAAACAVAAWDCIWR